MSSSEAPGAQPPPPGAAARLQPDQGDSTAWATLAAQGLDAEQRTESEDIDRRLGDVQLVQRLRAANFEGHEWEIAAQELARYGVDVINSWVRKGTIYEKCAQRKRPIKRPPDGTLDETERQSLVNGTVAEALFHFRNEVLIPGLWDPAKGASITTYFIGQCVLRFPELYRRWLSQVVRHDQGVELAKVQLGERLPPVEDDVIVSLANSDALRHVRNSDARIALVMTAQDYTQSEIAEHLGTTTKAVEGMIGYARKQIRKQTKRGA